MAHKRMFSKDVVRTDTFLDMSLTAQALYFHLSLDADVKGFVSPKSVMRMINAAEDDLRVLVLKGFVIPFESGVILVTHWNVNNQIRETHEAPSQYTKEFEKLSTTNAGVYQLQENYSSTTVELPHSIDKVRLEEIRLDENIPAAINITPDIQEVMDFWEKTLESKLPRSKGLSFHPLKDLVEHHGKEKVMGAILAVAQNMSTPYFPSINHPRDLENKWVQIMKSIQSNQILEAS